MKKIKLLLIFALSYFSVYSQNTFIGKAEYLEINNMNSVDCPKEQWANNIHSLYFNSEESIYLYDKDNETEVRITNGVQLGDGFAYDVIDLQSAYYTSFKLEEVLANEYDYDIALRTKENLAEINWKIGKETKKISEYNCFKASCKFRGREYEAWFTPQIPISAGPWKLQGLPGLILQAKDLTGQVQFLYNKIQYPFTSSTTKLSELFPKLDGEFISPLDIEELYLIEINKHRKQMMALIPEGATITFEGDPTVRRIELEFEEGIDAGIEYKTLK